MKPTRLLVLAFAMACVAAGPLRAMSSGPRLAVPVPQLEIAPLFEVQSQDVPEVVRLLARRARRAERRGDTATAEELYRTIRELGYVVRRPSSGAGTSGGNGRSGLFGGSRDNDDDDRDRDRDRDDDDDDDDDDDGDDDGDDGGDDGGGDDGDGDDDD